MVPSGGVIAVKTTFPSESPVIVLATVLVVKSTRLTVNGPTPPDIDVVYITFWPRSMFMADGTRGPKAGPL